MDDRADADLLDAWCRDRDESAFAMLVDRHRGAVLALCRRRLGNGADADDAAQAVFLLLAQRAGGIRRGERLASWLHGTALRVGRTIMRGRTRRMRRERLAAGPVVSAGDASRDRDLREALDLALERLSPKRREVVIRRHVLGQRPAQIARELGISDVAVGQRLRAGLADLEQQLRRWGCVGALALLADAATMAVDAGRGAWPLATPAAGALAARIARSAALRTAALLSAGVAMALTVAAGVVATAEPGADAPPVPQAATAADLRARGIAGFGAAIPGLVAGGVDDWPRLRAALRRGAPAVGSPWSHPSIEGLMRRAVELEPQLLAMSWRLRWDEAREHFGRDRFVVSSTFADDAATASWLRHLQGVFGQDETFRGQRKPVAVADARGEAWSLVGAGRDAAEDTRVLRSGRQVALLEREPAADALRPLTHTPAAAWTSWRGTRLAQLAAAGEPRLTDIRPAVDALAHDVDLIVDVDADGDVREVLVGDRAWPLLGTVDRGLARRLPAASWAVLQLGLDGPAAWERFAAAMQADPDLRDPETLRRGLRLDATVEQLLRGQRGGMALSLSPAADRLGPHVTLCATATPTADRLMAWAATELLQGRIALPPMGAHAQLPLRPAGEDEPTSRIREALDACGIAADRLHVVRLDGAWLITTDGAHAAAVAAGAERRPDLVALDAAAPPELQLGLLLRPDGCEPAWLDALLRPQAEGEPLSRAMRDALARVRAGRRPLMIVAGREAGRSVLDLRCGGLPTLLLLETLLRAP